MVERHAGVVRGFAVACRLEDIEALQAALAPDAIAICDGGALVPAAMSPVHGAEDVARLAAALLCGRPDAELTIEAVNGRAGLALRRRGRAVAVVAVEEAHARIAVLWIVLNPAKLRGWHRP